MTKGVETFVVEVAYQNHRCSAICRVVGERVAIALKQARKLVEQDSFTGIFVYAEILRNAAYSFV
ncbi:hypothetical protein BK643_00770 [Pseudomonas protegens]|nr:hypothetical protein BK643_00770 [Pseudomonas protegens]